MNPKQNRTEDSIISGLHGLYQSFGYQQFKMSKFEEYDFYVRNKNFLVSDHIITFTDTNGKLMALKPDVTLSIVKSNAKTTPGCVQRLYYQENVYRVSESSSSYKEIMQMGLECLGDVDDYAISEVVTLAARSLEAICPDYVLDVSHLGLLSEAISHTGISHEARAELLRRVGEKNLHGVEELCRDAGIEPSLLAPLKLLMTSYGDPEQVLSLLNRELTEDKWQIHLSQLSRILSACPAEKVRVDFSVVNNMSYYNGIVFKGFISGIPQSILSGGQYDLLMKKSEPGTGAIGFAIYWDLLEDLMAPRSEFDVDAVLLYDADANPARLAKAMEELTADGSSVTAQRALPEKLKYRRLLQLKESEVEILETNA